MLTKIVHDGWGDTSDSPSFIEYAIPGGIYHTIRGLLTILSNAVSNPAAEDVSFGLLARSHKITVT